MRLTLDALDRKLLIEAGLPNGCATKPEDEEYTIRLDHLADLGFIFYLPDDAAKLTDAGENALLLTEYYQLMDEVFDEALAYFIKPEKATGRGQ